MISQFLSGLVAVFALIGVGAILFFILHAIAHRYPFTRLALVLSLSPLSLVKFIERGGASTLYLYAMIVMLIGITIDGINHLLSKDRQEPILEEEPEPESEAVEEEPASGGIIWEKAD